MDDKAIANMHTSQWSIVKCGREKDNKRNIGYSDKIMRDQIIIWQTFHEKKTLHLLDDRVNYGD